MSRYSGVCDLADHISGLGGWYDRNGNSVKFGQDGVGAYYSDEMQDFEAFKKATGGVLYQHHRIKEVSEWNHNFIREHCDNFEIIKHETKIEDKRKKDGFRIDISYTYKYWNKEYTAKELKKKGGVYITTEIHFNTILELIPYYPYIVSACACSDGKQTVFISNESSVEEEHKNHLEHGWISGLTGYYRKELAKHYYEVCEQYLCKDLEARIKLVEIKNLEKRKDGDYYLTINDEIDQNHEVCYVWDDGKSHSHWTSPVVIDEHTIKLSRQDAHPDIDKGFLAEDIANNTVKIRYVKKLSQKIHLS